MDGVRQRDPRVPVLGTYTDACRIEADGVDDLVRFLDQQSGTGRVVLTDKGRLSKFLQETVGDAVFNCRSGKLWSVEFKIERKHTGNLFLETWSNLDRRNPGWMVKLDADILLYYFLDVPVLYAVNFQRLCKWAFGDSDEWTDGRQPSQSPGRIYTYPERRQNKYNQLNDTWGRCVNVDVLRRDVGMREYRRIGTGWSLMESSS